MTSVVAPTTGIVRPLAEAPDPVFAAELVGSGVAIEPTGDGRQAALAPVSGTVVKAHPHALAIAGADGRGVLVHLGIDTVKRPGFELLVATQDAVASGQEVVRWDPGDVRAAGLSPWVVVCVFDTAPGTVTSGSLGAPVAAGEPLFELPA